MIKPLPLNPELMSVAQKSVWFQPPDVTLNNSVHFLAYAMTYCTQETVSVLRRYLSDDEIRFALDNAPPGVFDKKSWCYWNVIVGRDSMPPLPIRNLDHIELSFNHEEDL